MPGTGNPSILTLVGVYDYLTVENLCLHRIELQRTTFDAVVVGDRLARMVGGTALTPARDRAEIVRWVRRIRNVDIIDDLMGLRAHLTSSGTAVLGVDSFGEALLGRTAHVIDLRDHATPPESVKTTPGASIACGQ